MHFEILVEDQSGKVMLEILVRKIIGDRHTLKVIAYKGIGRVPTKRPDSGSVKHRMLLDNLPRLLNGYGKSWENYPAAVFVVCDLDDQCLKTFRQELQTILTNCMFKPTTRFCIAVEEGEAWFLGDIAAIKSAYPRAKNSVLSNYKNDSICGTWEHLADAIHQGGSADLCTKGWHAVGAEKSEWAKRISPHMNVAENCSPSFVYFRNKLAELAQKAG
ncbi:MAG: hypothetical protein HUU55_20625 [Myxococcales bacterium]|nr:hypothetical protein [Myxococcales bacterium]